MAIFNVIIYCVKMNNNFFNFLRIILITISIILLVSSYYSEASKNKNIILITIDTLRADYIGAVNEKKINTPTIDSIAAEGALFTHVFATVPLTLPSHISILTGTYPSTHGVRNNGQIFNHPSIKLIPSILKNKGYHTYAITASYVLHSRFGLSKDFDYYSNVAKNYSLSHSISTQFIERKADEVVSIASVLTPTIKKPFFLWVHFFDPHAPYSPPPQFSHGSAVESYKGEIEYTDAAIAKLLALIKNYHLDENTIICITSDHGESLGEHKEMTHGHFLYNSTLRVPLIIKSNNIKPKKISSFISLIDIAPTLLNLLDIPIPQYMEGSSLLPIINANHQTDKNIIYAETLQPLLDNNWSPLFAIISNKQKYIYAPKPELYDLTTDFNELNNIINNKSNQYWLAKLKPFLKFPESAQQINSEDKEALLSLGYASGYSSSLININSIANLPDPKDTIEDLELIHSAMDKINNSHLDDAAKILSSLNQKNPLNTRTLYLLSLIYKYKNDYNTAISYLKKAADINKYYLSHYYLLSADMAIKNNNLTEAEKLYSLAIQYNPFETAAYYNLSQLAFKKKDLLAAEKFLKKTIELEPENLNALNNLSVLLIKEQKYDEAEKFLLNALYLYPKNEYLLSNLITIYLNKNDFQNAYKSLKEILLLNPTNEKYYLLIINCCQKLDYTKELINYRIALAELYFQMHQFDKALTQLNEVMKIQPDNPIASKMLKQIQNSYPSKNN
jgi:arylsulfatase A-like enzyme/Tfp pilus assembly protein PilF